MARFKIQFILSVVSICTAILAYSAPIYALSPSQFKTDQPTVLPPEEQMFIHHMQKKYDYDGHFLRNILLQERPNQEVLTIEHRPYAHKPWHTFSTEIVNPLRIRNGAVFMRQHRKVLNEARQKFGVDPYVITAIIGIESTYAARTGHFNALNVLFTLAFYYPTRAHYFQNELANFLILAQQWPGSVEAVQSSFDGGLGIPQFMPSTYRAYAMPYQKNAIPDLIHRPNDAIFSVANYLKKAGWDRNGFIASSIYPKSNHGHIKCTFHSQAITENKILLQADGFIVSPAIPDKPLACIVLQDQAHMRYWAVGDNFKSILRYNPQVYYAMSVYQLSQAIHKAERYH